MPWVYLLSFIVCPWGWVTLECGTQNSVLIWTQIKPCILAGENVPWIWKNCRKQKSWGRSQDGGGVGQGEHFLPQKFIKRAFKRRVNSTKQLLNAGRGHQAPRKATQLFERSATEQVSLKEKKKSVLHRPLCVRAETRYWRDQQTEEVITEGNALEATERRNTALPTRTLTQASLTRKPWQATCTNPHTARKRHNKENSTNGQNTERTPQTQQFKQDEETEEYPADKGTG